MPPINGEIAGGGAGNFEYYERLQFDREIGAHTMLKDLVNKVLLRRGDGMRKSLEDTWQYLASQGEETPRQADGRPFVHDAMPNHDDEELGFFYFKWRSEDADNSNLTLPRTFFGRSWFARVSFANTDLSESRMCWNEFENCDFSGADLSGCDMRGSVFKDCKFVGAILLRADLRRSTFDGCDFAGAAMAGAVAADENSEGCVDDFINAEQRGVMVFEDDGPEPPGG